MRKLLIPIFEGINYQLLQEWMNAGYLPNFNWPSKFHCGSDSKEQIKDMLIENINFYDFLQHIFYKQWSELKTYANKK